MSDFFRTRNRQLALLIVGLVAPILAMLAMGGCCSPSIDSWADRGNQGIQYAKENTQELAASIRKTLNEREASDLDAVFRDIKHAAKAGNLSDQWLNDHQAGLELIMAAWQRDRVAVNVAVAKAIDNLDQTAECFDQIKRLRKAFSLTPELQAQVEQLTIIVSQLVQETRNGK